MIQANVKHILTHTENICKMQLRSQNVQKKKTTKKKRKRRSFRHNMSITAWGYPTGAYFAPISIDPHTKKPLAQMVEGCRSLD